MCIHKKWNNLRVLKEISYWSIKLRTPRSTVCRPQQALTRRRPARRRGRGPAAFERCDTGGRGTLSNTTPPMSMLLSADQMESFETEGYLTVDALGAAGGLTPAELDAAEATWDRLTLAGVQGLSNSGPERPESLERQAELAADKGFIELMCHPVFEDLAKQVLKSENVRVIELGPHARAPTTDAPPTPEAAKEIWRNQSHIDFQVTTEDFAATPRRDLLGIWFWVNDVPEERGAMRILPGSHRPISAHWSNVLTQEQRSLLPRCHGMRTNPPITNNSYPEHIPEPADWRFS